MSFDNRLPEWVLISLTFTGKYIPDEDLVIDKINNSDPFVINIYWPNGEVLKDVLVKATVSKEELIWNIYCS